ncbi:MAG: hypothetical protein HY741_09690 [Chloroflexi bacterium]|nr:hypothetical protein [Chloroflexota bacterium]
MLPRHNFVVVFVLLAALLWLAIPIVRAATVTVSAPTVEAQADGAVDVPIQLAGAQGLGALHIELVYDPRVLTPETVTRGALAGMNALVESNTKQAGRVVIGVVSLDGISGDGAVATVRFRVVGNAGQSSALTFENNQAWERASHAEVLVNSQPGQVTIAAGLPSWLVPALIGLGVLLVSLLVLIFFVRRRKPAPQPAYAQPIYAPPQTYTPPPAPAAPPSTFPSRSAPPPPMQLPESKMPAPPNAAAFQRAEDEYFELKGQMATGRITHEQFEAQLRELMVQDAQGRYWMLGADTGKWYVHDGTQWIEREPD